jgi:hypothetical protein
MRKVGDETVTNRLLKSINKDTIEREVDEELGFHLDLLTQENLLQDMPIAEARTAALNRFGNLEQIKDECVEISRNRHPVIRALKSLMIGVFLLGVLIRVVGTEIHVTRVGNILIVVAILTRLLLYVRSLKPSRFRSTTPSSSPLRLIEKAQPSIRTYERHGLTPVERVIADK